MERTAVGIWSGELRYGDSGEIRDAAELESLGYTALEEFAKHLRTAGVDTTLRHYDGVAHEFFGAAAVLDKANDAQRSTAVHMAKAFSAQSTTR